MTDQAHMDSDDIRALQKARDVLAQRLEAHECWRALRQLNEREARGDVVQSVDAVDLRHRLEAILDGSCPGWRAWSALDKAVATVADWRPGVTIAAPEPVVVRMQPKAETPVPPVSTRPAPEPTAMKQPLPSATESAVVVGPADLTRIRQIGRRPDVTHESEPARGDRFGGAVPWAKLGEPPPVPVELPRAVIEAALTHRGKPRPSATPPRSLDAPSLAASEAAARAFAPIKRTPSAAPEVSPEPHAVAEAVAKPAATSEPAHPPLPSPATPSTTVDTTSFDECQTLHDEEAADVEIVQAPDRLSRLESELDQIVGGADGVRKRSGRDANTAINDDLDVEEAEVVIVARRPELEAPEPEVAPPSLARPPVALSIRLKADERAVEFDSDDYAAYHDDVEEAEVEIIRPDENGGASARAATSKLPAAEPPKPSSGRRLLKALARE